MYTSDMELEQKIRSVVVNAQGDLINIALTELITERLVSVLAAPKGESEGSRFPESEAIAFTRYEVEMAQQNAIGAEDSTQITVNLNRMLEVKLRAWRKASASEGIRARALEEAAYLVGSTVCTIPIENEILRPLAAKIRALADATKVPQDPSPTPWDFSTWGYYCDHCKKFFKSEEMDMISLEDGFIYKHTPCGNTARYIGYDHSVGPEQVPEGVVEGLRRKITSLGQHAAKMESRAAKAENRVAELEALLNTPEIEDFDKAVPLEAAHQVLRWTAEHDAGKNPEDWFWLVGYLAGKALHASKNCDIEKAKHHCVSTSAALRNWHAHLRTGESAMRPGIEPPELEDAKEHLLIELALRLEAEFMAGTLKVRPTVDDVRKEFHEKMMSVLKPEKT